MGRILDPSSVPNPSGPHRNIPELASPQSRSIYPLSATATVTPLAQPHGVAISGFDQTVYIADSASGLVYAANGPGGTALTTVDAGTIVLRLRVR